MSPDFPDGNHGHRKRLGAVVRLFRRKKSYTSCPVKKISKKKEHYAVKCAAICRFITLEDSMEGHIWGEN
jgi:hypothetical protein